MASPVSAEDLTVRFNGFKALDGVTHTFEPGTSTAVMGVNGSGKTTLLECLAGLQRPSSGRAVGMPKDLAYVCQHLPAHWMPITVDEVVAMGRYRSRGPLGRLTHHDREAMAAATNRLGVSDLTDRSFGSLSSGQQQRVRIAQALACEPDVIMMDEPVTGLDLATQECILDVIEQYASQGAVVIITTHHLDEARHCDSVVLLANRLVAAGTPEEMLTPARLRETFGERLLGDHAEHDHGHELIVLDDHGHHGHGQHAKGHDHGDHGDHGHGHAQHAKGHG